MLGIAPLSHRYSLNSRRFGGHGVGVIALGKRFRVMDCRA